MFKQKVFSSGAPLEFVQTMYLIIRQTEKGSLAPLLEDVLLSTCHVTDVFELLSGDRLLVLISKDKMSASTDECCESLCGR